MENPPRLDLLHRRHLKLNLCGGRGSSYLDFPSKSSNLKTIAFDPNNFRRIGGRLWEHSDRQWTLKILPEFLNQTIFSDGNVYNFRSGQFLSVLELSGDDMPAIFVNIPPNSNINCLIKLSDGGAAALYPVDVTVATDNQVAEALLALITSGAMREAETLTKDFSFNAEMLLYGKVENPIAAAIGGYFLLKTGELDRLHDWANNLANWFTWMPDGAIIHAWQLMAEKGKTPELVNKIRARLLEAVDRGIPIYTEGLRLLYDGLTQLWYHAKNNDSEVELALKKISGYVEAVDWSQKTTTYTGTAPDQPRKFPLQSKESPVVSGKIVKQDEELVGA